MKDDRLYPFNVVGGSNKKRGAFDELSNKSHETLLESPKRANYVSTREKNTEQFDIEVPKSQIVTTVPVK